MTYCVAWKSLGTIFMISDTARTIEDNHYKPEKTISSIGEDFFHCQNTTVEEWIHKQYRIEDSIIMTFAGDITLAHEIIDNTRRAFMLDDPLKSFEMALDAVRNPERPESVKFFIGLKKQRRIHLYSYNYNMQQKCKIVEVDENTFVQIGSLSQTQYGDLARKMYYEHVIDLKTPAEQFYQAISFIQHLGLHNNTFAMYAGGIYTGIFLDWDGVHWAQDTTIVLYNKNISNENEVEFIGNINYFIRHDVFIVSSTFTKQGEIFIDRLNNPVYLSQQLQEEIEAEHRLFQPKIIIFLAKDERLIIVIKTNGYNCNNHFYYKNVEGKQELFFYDEFMKILKLKNINPKNSCFIYWNEVFKKA